MRVSSSAASVAVALVAFSAQSLAASPPTAPQVTMGAGLKVLRFDWEPVPGADFYRLWVRPGGTRYISVGPRIPASITHAEHEIPVHLQNWERLRYVVTACNSAGCTHSAALNPQRLMLDTIGYLKASNTDPDDNFGHDVVLSDDGRTLAVSAEHESSSATGVNGNQSDNSSSSSGAVYIFRRSGAGWRQDAYLKPPVNRSGINFGTGTPTLSQRAIALSSDGSIAAIAAPAQDVGTVGDAGEVYVFRRAGGRWSLAATLRNPEPGFFDYFGFSVDMTLDGSTIKVSSMYQRRQPSGEITVPGRTYIFDRSGTTWVHSATLPPFYPGDLCEFVRMSGDGRTLVQNCTSPAGSRAVTFKRSGGAWVHVNDLAVTAFIESKPLELNFDATRMALTQVGSNYSVGVYRWEGSAWVKEGDIAAPSSLGRSQAFAEAMAFDRDGSRLAIGDFFIAAAGAGVSSVPAPGSGNHGAVFLYERTGALPSPWKLRSVIKAPNPGVEDLFGITVSLSGSGRTLAVGAYFENSNARGIDGDQTNESAPDAGAAYLY